MASAAWERRNARARKLGYRNYYDYRAHHYGQRPAALPAARGPALRRLRGHAGGGELRRALRAGRIDMINVVQTDYDPPEFEINAVMANGRTRVYTLRGQRQLDAWAADLDEMDDADVPMIVGSPKALAAMRGA